MVPLKVCGARTAVRCSISRLYNLERVVEMVQQNGQAGRRGNTLSDRSRIHGRHVRSLIARSHLNRFERYSRS